MALLKLNNILKCVSNFEVLKSSQSKLFHNSAVLSAWQSDRKPTNKWLKYNDVIYPPQKPGEEPRPAFVCHQRLNIRYSPYKMWYVACFVRGMSVDEAIRQLKFVAKKGAKDVRETIEEAKELAIKEHNVEFGTNLWVAESFVGKGPVIKGIRRHARGRHGIIHYVHCHYYVRLEEGKPPKNYYQHEPKEPHEQLEDWLKEMRRRKISNSL